MGVGLACSEFPVLVHSQLNGGFGDIVNTKQVLQHIILRDRNPHKLIRRRTESLTTYLFIIMLCMHPVHMLPKFDNFYNL